MRKKELRKQLKDIAESKTLISPKCPFFGKCGGCFMQDVDYEGQLEAKQIWLQKMFDSADIEITAPKPIASPETFNYRNRMDFPIGENGEIGLKPMGKWRDVIDLTECHLLSEDATKIRQIVREWMKKWNVPGWNAVRHRGYMRYVVIREGKNTNQRMVMIVTHEDSSVNTSSTRGEGAIQKIDRSHMWEDLVAQLQPLATTIYHAINPRITDISFGDELRLLHGEAYLKEVVNGITFNISPFSFFQTNTKASELLQNHVISLIPENETNVLDLYCGSGFFTLPLAKKGIQATGVELDQSSIEMALVNAQENNIENAEFHALDAKEHAKELLENQYNTIIVDPPRSGLHPKVLKKLIEIKPKNLIYVSCAPQRLVHELELLLEHYDISHIKTFDMFPHTPHVETVVQLTHKEIKG